MKKLILLSVVAIGFAPLSASPAQAADPKADKHSCVANREANSINFGTMREEVERRWEVTGKGVDVITPLGWTAVAYPWCGHQFRNHSIVPTSYVAAAYSGRGRLRAILWVLPTVQIVDPPAPVDPSPTTEPEVPTPTPSPTGIPCTPPKCLH